MLIELGFLRELLWILPFPPGVFVRMSRLPDVLGKRFADSHPVGVTDAVDPDSVSTLPENKHSVSPPQSFPAFACNRTTNAFFASEISPMSGDQQKGTQRSSDAKGDFQQHFG